MRYFLMLPLRITLPLFLFLAALAIDVYTLRKEMRGSDTEVERDALTFVSQEMTGLQGDVNALLRKGYVNEVQRIITNAGAHPDISTVVLVDDDYRIRYSTSLKLIGLPAGRALPVMDTEIMRTVRATMAGKTFLEKERGFVYGYYPVTLGTEKGELVPTRTGILFMSFDLSAPKAIHRRILEREWLTSTFFYGLLFLFLWLFLRRVITKRAARLVYAVGEFEAGNLRVRAGLQGQDELARIGEAFDRMADRTADVQEALRKAYEYIQQLISAANVMIIGLDTSGHVKMFNRAAERTTGYSIGELEGVDWFEKIVPRDRYPHVWDMFQGYIEKAGVLPAVFENPILTKSREERIISWQNSPIAVEGGNIATISFGIDITESRKAEEKLKELSRRNELILESAGEGILGLDIEGNITFINRPAASMLGYETGDLTGRHSHSTWHYARPNGALYPEEECPIYAAHKYGDVHAGEDMFLRKDGTRFPVEFSSTPLYEKDTITGSVVIFRDITERKRAKEALTRLNEELEQRVARRTADIEKKSLELRDSQMALTNIVEDLNLKTTELGQANDKLKELDRLKSMFIASMSHELRTPLNSIIGFSSIMLNEWAGPVTSEQKENLDAVLRSGKHLLSLINDVIDVSKIEAGAVESIAEEFDVYDLMSEAAAAFAKDAEKKGLELRVEAVHQVMRTDRRRLLQCLLNLVSNAVKFSEKGMVSVCGKITGHGETVEISVSDSGIGISEDGIQKLFSPFVRLESPLKSKVPGTGLGLYLTKKLMTDVLKGDIFITSKLGEGSRFALRVPVAGSRTA